MPLSKSNLNWLNCGLAKISAKLAPASIRGFTPIGSSVLSDFMLQQGVTRCGLPSIQLLGAMLSKGKLQ